MEKGKPGKREMKNRRGELDNVKWKKTRRQGMEKGKGEIENEDYKMKARKWKKGNLEKEK
jgi:Mg-chelatase subunit ChlD